MTAYFVDSSGLVKLYIQETGSGWLQALLGPGRDEVVVAEATLIEVTSALFRAVRAGTLSAHDAQGGAADLLVNARLFQLVAFDSAILQRSIAVAQQHALRGYDCIQLGTALVTNDRRLAAGLDPIILISADAELNAAAGLEGLAVEDPNSH